MMPSLLGNSSNYDFAVLDRPVRLAKEQWASHVGKVCGTRLSEQMQGGEKLIRLPKLFKTVGISRATAYRYVANGRLPKPVRLSSRCVAWKASAVNEWLAGLVAA